jgi:MFS family permease
MNKFEDFMARRYYRSVFMGSFILMLAASLVSSCLSFFIQPVTEDLRFERGAFTFYYSLIFLVSTLTMPVLGRLIQKKGVRLITLIGGFICSLAFSLFAFARSLIAFYAIALVMGLFFNASTFLAASISINIWFEKRRGTILGLVMSATGFGTAIFSFILPPLIQDYGWRAGYLFLAICWLLLTVPAGLFLIKKPPEAYGLMAYGDRSSSEQNSKPVLTGMTASEAKRTKSLYFLMGSLVLSSAMISGLQHLPSHFISQGMNKIQLGALMSVLSLMLILAKIGTGVLSDKIGIWGTYAVFSAAGMIAYFILYQFSQFNLLIMGVLFLAVFYASISIMPSLTTLKIFGKKEFPAIWGLVSMAISLGQVIGTPIWGSVYDWTGTYQPAFLTALFLILLAFLMISLSLAHLKK